MEQVPRLRHPANLNRGENNIMERSAQVEPELIHSFRFEWTR